MKYEFEKFEKFEKLSLKKNSNFKIKLNNADSISIINKSYNFITISLLILVFYSLAIADELGFLLIISYILIFYVFRLNKFIQTCNKITFDLKYKKIEISNRNILGKLKFKQIVDFNEIQDFFVQKWKISDGIGAQTMNRIKLQLIRKNELDLLDLTFKNYENDIDPDILISIMKKIVKS